MGTRSDIIVKVPGAANMRSIYCHSDGYIEHNGRILQAHYNTYDAVNKLIDMGGLSYLGETPETTRSYHLWRGEPIEIFESPVLMDHTNLSYSYLFTGGKWYVKPPGIGWVDLEYALTNPEMEGNIPGVYISQAGEARVHK